MRFTKVGACILSFQTVGIGAAAGVVASASIAVQPRMNPPHARNECSLPPGWDAVAAREPRFVVFGELHGTQQAPDFVGDLACALALHDDRVLVAVEHSSSRNDAFQKAWDLPAAQFPAALKQAGWADRDDGVGSEAMLALLVRLHRLARLGRTIDIVAFSGAKDEVQAARFSRLPGQGPHEAAQAENIRSAAAARPYDHVLVLVGNGHARKRPVTYSGTTFEPMAMRLGPSPGVVTLDMETAGGTAWNCQLKPGVKPEPTKPMPPDAIACDSYPVSGGADVQRTPFIALRTSPGNDQAQDYDGVFWLGRVSASPPAVRSN